MCKEDISNSSSNSRIFGGTEHTGGLIKVGQVCEIVTGFKHCRVHEWW